MATNGQVNNDPIQDLLKGDFLICPVCQEQLKAPKILPCLHSFCFECLKNSLAQSNIGPGQSFLCPLCKLECHVPPRGVAAMKTNIFAVTLEEYRERRSLASDQECEGCDSGARAKRKCLECNDWLCSQCCHMHKKVRVTSDHSLVSASELQTGKYDQVIKDTFEPLYCSIHGEPLKLYCTATMCRAPICTVCKSTPGHDGHVAIELEAQGAREAQGLAVLVNEVKRNIGATNTKMSKLRHEEKLTAQTRKRIHKAINQRMEDIVAEFVKQVGEYAETLHEDVERIVTEHKNDLKTELEQSQKSLASMQTAHTFGKNLLNFGKAHELVVMSKDVKEQLMRFQTPPKLEPPGWRQPRLQPADDMDEEELAEIFGKLTFEGCVVRCVPVRSFTAQAESDEKVCALCDISVTMNNELVIIDRDNRQFKIYDQNYKLRAAVGNRTLKSPNRVVCLKDSGRLLIKDDKALKLYELDGSFVSTFAISLRQPVGLAQNDQGEIFITDWMSGFVQVFSEAGKHLREFMCASEAPGYICVTQSGHVALTDWKQHVLKVFSREGNLLHQYGGHGAGDGQMDHPYGVCADRYGHIIVADTWNNRVHLLTEEARYVRTLLTAEDGIQWPQALAVTKEGMLVVVEQHGNIKLYQYMA